METYSYFYYSQTIRFNIIDTETNSLIEEDLHLKVSGAPLPSYYKQFSIIKGGTGETTATILKEAGKDRVHTHTIEFYNDRLEALGYNPNSVKGNTITAFIDPETGLPKYPTIMNIYISKK